MSTSQADKDVVLAMRGAAGMATIVALIFGLIAIVRTMPSQAADRSVNITATAFSPDGKLLAIGTSTGEVHLADATIWETPKIPRIKRKRPDVISALSFSADSQLLAVSSGNQTEVIRFARRESEVNIMATAKGLYVEKRK